MIAAPSVAYEIRTAESHPASITDWAIVDASYEPSVGSYAFVVHTSPDQLAAKLSARPDQ